MCIIYYLSRSLTHSRTAFHKTNTTQHKQARWANLTVAVSRFERRVQGSTTGSGDAAMAFEFVEGLLVQAVREGHWVLLDEINLASAEVSV